CCHGIGALPSGTLIKPPEPKMTRARSSPDAYRKTAMSDDKTGWDCMVGNQASLGRQYPLVSTATYCKAEVK
ncbi:hypothetical protein ABIB99_009035, partial [Bradyrhizobium sp. LA6.1]|uniref:hypothetical protein n=1 Tax=Bradyrhizobium sp. LA6.1 TaxID=3156378 RepID=UPI003391B3CE